MKRKFLIFFFLASAVWVFTQISLDTLNLQSLSKSDRNRVDSILEKVKQAVDKKNQESAAVLLTWNEFNQRLTWRERQLIKKIRKLRPRDLGVTTPAQKDSAKTQPMMLVRNQTILKDGKPLVLEPQAVSLAAYAAYEKMMSAMEKDIGKKLYIESGHRAPAFHLYNFLTYLRDHKYSLIETAKLNALPGYSEHNLEANHALDLINAEGINGEPRVEDYEALPEHQWMLKHAGEYGFTLSYPRDNPFGIDFEPWHWRYAGK